jgi:hypothetical protein
MQMAGVHIDLITKWVGHTDFKITWNYTHFSDKFRKDEANRVGQLDPLDPVGQS